MLIDWLSLRVPYATMSSVVRYRAMAHSDRLCRYDPRNGEVIWESAAWDSVRSDSHQVTLRSGSDALHVQGSPARAMGDGDSVFGAQPYAMDLRCCVASMLTVASRALSATLPVSRAIVVTRADVTDNLLLGSLADVRVALSVLRNVEGGRYRVSQQAGDTVYWSHRSRLRAGKAYAKGPHLRYLARRGVVDLDEEFLALADRLLRFELRLGAQWWRERSVVSWADLSVDDLRREWHSYFDRMLGEDVDVSHEVLYERVIQSADTPRAGRSVWSTWCLIESVGWERARAMMSRPTWYRHLSVLRRAGLGDADLSAGRVVPLRRRVVGQSVSTWSELREAA